MSNPAVARNLPLLFSHRLETLGCNGAPFDYVRGHECMVTRHGHIHYGDVVALGSKVVDTLCEVAGSLRDGRRDGPFHYSKHMAFVLPKPESS